MPHNTLIAIIAEQKAKEEKKDIWANSPYKDLVKLQSNNAGIVGETLVNRICSDTGLDACCDGSKTKQVGGGEGDGKVLGQTVEIKTAHQGSGSPTFQHEMGEVPWKAKYIIFVDISPDAIYLTIFPNFSEEIYKSGKQLPYCFPTKKVTWRKKQGAFKLDTTVKINQKNITDGYTIKIGVTTTAEEVAAFIRKMIV